MYLSVGLESRKGAMRRFYCWIRDGSWLGARLRAMTCDAEIVVTRNVALRILVRGSSDSLQLRRSGPLRSATFLLLRSLGRVQPIYEIAPEHMDPGAASTRRLRLRRGRSFYCRFQFSPPAAGAPLVRAAVLRKSC